MSSLDITRFDYAGQQVRTVLVDGEVRIVLTDIAKILGYRSASDAARLLREQHQGYATLRTPGGPQTVLTTNEAGFNRLVLRSNASNAEAVQDWVTDEVLPSIRRTGSYSAPVQSDDEIVARALQITAARVQALEAKVAEDAPKVLFADSVATSQTTILVGDLAKILKGNGMDIGGTRLFELLRNDGYLIKRQGTDRNMPTQKAMELGLFKVKETAVTHSDGHVTISKTPKVTGKGQAYFVNRYAGQPNLRAVSA